MAGVTRSYTTPPAAEQHRSAFRRDKVPTPPAAMFRGQAIKRFVFPPLGGRRTVHQSFL